MSDFRGTQATTWAQDGRGFQWLRSGINPVSPVAVPATITKFYIRQQQPENLQPQLWPGVVPRGTRAPVTDTVIVRQQQPYHPPPFVLRGVPIANPPPFQSYTNSIFTRQAVPYVLLVQQPYMAHSTQPSTLENPWVFGYTVQ